MLPSSHWIPHARWKEQHAQPHIIKPGNKATGKQHPIAAGFDGSVDRRVGGIGYGKGHAGYGEHPVYGTIAERNDGFPVDLWTSLQS